MYEWWIGWNRIVFSKALNVITLSEGMRKVLEKYVDKGRIRVIPNWTASEKFRPVKKNDNLFYISILWVKSLSFCTLAILDIHIMWSV